MDYAEDILDCYQAKKVGYLFIKWVHTLERYLISISSNQKMERFGYIITLVSLKFLVVALLKVCFANQRTGKVLVR